MKTLIIGEICKHEEIKDENKIEYFGGLYIIYNWFITNEKMQYIAITGNDLINKISKNKNLDVVYAMTESSSVTFFNTISNQSTIIDNKCFDSDYLIERLRQYNLKEYSIYCPAFPGYEQIIKYLLNTDCELYIDFGFLYWLSDYNKLIENILKYDYHNHCTLQINGGNLTYEQKIAIVKLLKTKNVINMIMTNNHGKIFSIWQKRYYEYKPIIKEYPKTFGAGDIFIAKFISTADFHFVKRLAVANKEVIKYLNYINGI